MEGSNRLSLFFNPLLHIPARVRNYPIFAFALHMEKCKYICIFKMSGLAMNEPSPVAWSWKLERFEAWPTNLSWSLGTSTAYFSNSTGSSVIGGGFSSHSLLRLYGLAITMLLTDRNFNTSIDGGGVLNQWFAPLKTHQCPSFSHTQATKSSALLNHTCAPWLFVLWWHPSLDTHVAPHLPCNSGSRGSPPYLSIWFNPQLSVAKSTFKCSLQSDWSTIINGPWMMSRTKKCEAELLHILEWSSNLLLQESPATGTMLYSGNPLTLPYRMG